MINWDEILDDFAHKCGDGGPDMTNPNHLALLRETLLKSNTDFNDYEIAVNALVGNLREGEKKYSDNAKNRALGRVGLPWGSKGTPPEKEEPKGEEDGEGDANSEKSVNKVSGNPEEGDNKVKNEMLEHGYNGMEDKTGTKPAPGNPGSAFNEIVSGEGVHMLEENPDMSEQELAQQMFDQFGSSALGEEQTQASGISPEDYPPHIIEAINKAKGGGTLDNPDDPEALKKAKKDKAVMSKCIIAARSSKQKHARSVERTKSLQEKGLLGKNTETKTFYGAEDSKQAQLSVVENARKKGAKVLLPNGRVVDYDDAIAFINAGGGGDNPSDTGTFITDDEGNVMLQFHSDKMATSDIQDNSTLAKEGDNYKEYINKAGLSEDQSTAAIAVVDDYANQMEEIEENYNDLATPIAKRLDALPIEEQIDIIEKDKGTLKKNVQNAIFVKKSGAFREKYRKYLPKGKEPEDLTDREKYEMVLKLVADGEAKADDTKVINKVASAVANRNPEIEGLDVKKNLASQRKKVVNLQRERVKELNKTKVDVDGVEKGLGELMEAEECERAFHLSLMDEHDYEPPADETDMSDEEKQKAQENRFKGIMDSAFDVNMGGNVVTGETLRECIGVANTTEMKQNFVLQEAEGKDKHGRDARFTYDSNKPDANVTGKKVFVYAVKKGEEASEANRIGFKTYRSKAGADGKTNNTMQYSKSMRECFEGKN